MSSLTPNHLRPMEIHQLRYFRAVAECRSFTRAAKRENVSQPSLSQQVMKLESELGAKLFSRKGLAVALTSFGEALLPKVETILQQLREAQIQISEMVGVDNGRVTLGVIPTVAPFLLPNLLSGFLKMHPLIEVKVREDCSGALLEWLREETIDLGIMPLSIDADDLLHTELMHEKLFAIVGNEHPLQNEKQLSLEQLSGAPFLLLKDGHCFRDDTLAAFRLASVEPRIIFESGCFLTILNMVKAGIGISVMPEMAVCQDSGCKFIPIASDRPVRTIALVEPKERYRTRAQNLLGSFIKAHFHRTAEPYEKV